MSARLLILASSSPYRRQLLARLGLPFEVAVPQIDERRRENERPGEMVARLSRDKANALRDRFPGALVIGSDQCAVIHDSILGKPGGFEQARLQLQEASGNTVVFHTGLCLLDAATGHCQIDDILFSVHFRALSDAQITRYLEREKPYDCAGSFKSEGLGVALFERMAGEDPNALMGLPLIRLVDMLSRAGVDAILDAP